MTKSMQGVLQGAMLRPKKIFSTFQVDNDDDVDDGNAIEKCYRSSSYSQSLCFSLHFVFSLQMHVLLSFLSLR